MARHPFEHFQRPRFGLAGAAAIVAICVTALALTAGAPAVPEPEAAVTHEAANHPSAAAADRAEAPAGEPLPEAAEPRHTDETVPDHTHASSRDRPDARPRAR